MIPNEVAPTVQPPRLAAVRSPVWRMADPHAQEHFLGMVARLRAAGAEVQEQDLPPSFAGAHAAHRTIMYAEGARVYAELQARDRDRLSPRLNALIDEGLGIPDTDLSRGLEKDQLASELDGFLSAFDGIITPPALGEAPADRRRPGTLPSAPSGRCAVCPPSPSPQDAVRPACPSACRSRARDSPTSGSSRLPAGATSGSGGVRGSSINKVSTNGAACRDPALCGFCECSHLFEYAALSKTPHALADGLMLVFHHPVKRQRSPGCRSGACRRARRRLSRPRCAPARARGRGCPG